MKPICLVSLFIIFAVLSCKAQQQTKVVEWKEFISKEAGFKALFPLVITTSSEVVVTTPIKRINYRFEVSLNRGYFAVHYSDHPILPKFDKEALKSNYDYLKNNIANITKAEVLSEKDIKLEENLGREVIFKLKDEAIIVRFYLIEKRLFQNIISITYSDLKNEKLQKEIDKFFNSFQLLKK